LGAWFIDFFFYLSGKTGIHCNIRQLSMEAAQAVHTFGHLKGVVIHDDTLLRDLISKDRGTN